MFIVFINFVCAAIFSLLAYACFISRRPVSFWSGEKVSKEQLTSVEKYNFANGLLWAGYSIFYWVASVCGFINVGLSMIITILGLTVGIAGLLIGNYIIRRRFFHEYRDRYIASKLNDYK